MVEWNRTKKIISSYGWNVSMGKNKKVFFKGGNMILAQRIAGTERWKVIVKERGTIVDSDIVFPEDHAELLVREALFRFKSY